MSLDLTVVRHGIAVDRSPEREDAARALTPEGRSRFARGARGLSALGIGFDRIAHSPWLRAVQTAELLAPLLQAGGRVSAEPGLARAPARSLLESLGEGRVALVGHEPWLSELIAWLATGDPGNGGAFALKKGAVARLRGEALPGAISLSAFLPPKVLRRLGRASKARG